jgi:hypothetical protein
MVSEGVKIRAQIDAESVRNVMLVNGGGAVALLAFLPAILGTPLVFGVLLTLAIWLVGLTLAVIHSVLRRKCSLLYEQHNMRPPAGTRTFCIRPNEPWICWWSWQCLYASILAFLVGGAAMVSIGFANVDVLSAPPEPAKKMSTESRVPHTKRMQGDALTRAPGARR